MRAFSGNLEIGGKQIGAGQEVVMLARIEGGIAFSTLLKRFPTIRLETEEVAWQCARAGQSLRPYTVPPAAGRSFM